MLGFNIQGIQFPFKATTCKLFPCLAFAATLIVLLPNSPKAQGLKYPGCSDLTTADFSRKELAKGNIAQPMELDIAANGDVYFSEKLGAIKVWRATGGVKNLGNLPVTATGGEKSLMGFTLDPRFPQSPYIYAWYDPSAEGNTFRLSRFTLNNDALDLASEKIIFKAKQSGGSHIGGSIAFGKGLDLFISLGESAPWNHDTPTGEQWGTAANSNSYWGGMLRITVTDEGGYTIPENNLYPKTETKAKPEVYVKGARNPYRIWADPVTGYLYWGEVGGVYEEYNFVKEPGYYGWPIFDGNGHSLMSGAQSQKWETPTNTDGRNSGLQQLPPGRKPLYAYTYTGNTDAAFNYKNKVAIAGPVYHYNGSSTSTIKFPPHFDKTWIIGDWQNSFVRALEYDAATSTVKQVVKLFDGIKMLNPIDLEFGPDGALYMLEFGGLGAVNNPGAALSRIEYNGVCRPAVTSIKNARNTESKVHIPSAMRKLMLLKASLTGRQLNRKD